MMNAGRVFMSYALLAEFLKLPKGAEIRGIRQVDFRPYLFEMLIEHPDLPEVEEGTMPPKVEITWQYSAEKGWLFDSWSEK